MRVNWLSFYEKAKPLLMSENYNHWEWFYGSVNVGETKYGGYSLAFNIVERALTLMKANAIEVCNEPSRSFLEKFKED